MIVFGATTGRSKPMSEGAPQPLPKSGYDKRRARRIYRHLRRSYPDMVELPTPLRCTATLFELHRLGHIEFPQMSGITRTVSGELTSVNVHRAILTPQGYADTSFDRGKAIGIVAMIITAVSTGTVAVLDLIERALPTTP